jgi:hypothetical protein
MHCSLDLRTALPKVFLGFYPATIPQSELDEGVNIITAEGKASRFAVGPPKKTEGLAPRDSYETKNATDPTSFGPTEMRPLGDIALGRSGDKGGNVNLVSWQNRYLNDGDANHESGFIRTERFSVGLVPLIHDKSQSSRTDGQRLERLVFHREG